VALGFSPWDSPENSLYEGHGFSRAANSSDMLGFSR